MGKKYDAETLRQGVERYFASIRRRVPVKILVPSGDFDKYGHPLMVPEIVENELGKIVYKTEYLVPPMQGGICKALGISRDTWENYGKDPELSDIVEAAREECKRWNIEQLLTREGRNTRGIEFNLLHNYGMVEKKSEENRSVEAFLRAVEGRKG